MELEQTYLKLIDDLVANAHGVPALQALKVFLKTGFKNTAARSDFWKGRLTQETIVWDEIKAQVWADDKSQKDNCFHFLQGDIIESSFVLSLGSARSGEQHSLWMIVSPDCDCVRAEYIRVAPIFLLADDFKNEYSVAVSLGSPKFFPLPAGLFEADGPGAQYFADLSAPYFLEKKDKASVVAHYSLQPAAWHILNSIIKDAETRANIEEGLKIRTANA